MSEAAPKLRVVQGNEGVPPPYDEAAEAAVCSAVLLSPPAIVSASEILHFEQFYLEPHRLIFQAASDLFEKRQPIEVTQVASWLNARKLLPKITSPGAPDGYEALIRIADASPAVHNVRAHAISVHECWRRRRVIATCDRILNVGYGSVPDVQKYCDDATRSIALIALKNPTKPIEGFEDALERIIKRALAPAPDPNAAPTGLEMATGMPRLDRLLHGLRRKAKTTIAAESGVGKTSAAVQIAIHIALAGLAVYFASTELTLDELVQRGVCMLSGVPNDKIKNHNKPKPLLTSTDIHAIFEAANRLRHVPIRVDTTASLTIDQLKTRAEAFKEEAMLIYRKPLGLVVGDYVQRFAVPGHLRDREQREQFAYSTKQGKIMAQELDVAYLEIAQSNKPKKTGKRVERSIYGSSAIVHEADDVIFIEEDPGQEPDAPVKDVTFVVAKQRDGGRGPIEMRFNGPLFRFDDPNAPSPSLSRQYIDTTPEPPEDDGSETLTRNL